VAADGHPGGGEDAARVALEPPLGEHGDDPAVRLGAGGDGPAHAVGGRVEDVADGDRHGLAAAALEHGGDAVGVVGEGVAVSGRGRLGGGVLQQLGAELRQPDDEGPQVPPAALVAQRVELGPLVGDDLLARLRPLLLGAQTAVEVVEPGEDPVQDVRFRRRLRFRRRRRLVLGLLVLGRLVQCRASVVPHVDPPRPCRRPRPRALNL
jgi:hypothetical protein